MVSSARRQDVCCFLRSCRLHQRRQPRQKIHTTAARKDVFLATLLTAVIVSVGHYDHYRIHGFTAVPIQRNVGARQRPLPLPSSSSSSSLLKSLVQDDNHPQPILSFDDVEEDDDDDIFGMINDCGEGGSSDFDDDDDGDLDWFRFASIDELYSPPDGQQGQSKQDSQEDDQEDVLERLQASTVAIVGVGGVGTWAAEALCRSGVGHFVLVDLDDVCVSQTTSSLSSLKSNVGKFKTDTLRQRLLDIHPTVKVTTVNDFIKVGDNVDNIVSKQFVHSEHKVDLVIDTIDNVADRAALWTSCCKQGIKIITTGNPGGRKDPTKIQVSTLSQQDTITDEWLVQAREYISKNYSNNAINDGNEKEDCSLKLMDNVLCIHSNEVPVKGPYGAECLGSVCFVSGTFGFVAASQAIEKLLEPRSSS